MDTALYYTLSTVSQTLAGALGMLAAFLAIRITALEAALRADLAELEARTAGPSVGVRPESGSVAETLAGWRLRFSTGDFERGSSYGALLLRRAEQGQESKATLLREAQWAFILSAAVMVGCFVGLASTPWLGQVATRGASAAGLALSVRSWPM
jgi:hypothetical protein